MRIMHHCNDAGDASGEPTARTEAHRQRLVGAVAIAERVAIDRSGPEMPGPAAEPFRW